MQPTVEESPQSPPKTSLGASPVSLDSQPIKVITGDVEKKPENSSSSRNKWKDIILGILVAAIVLLIFMGTFVIGYLAWILGVVVIVIYIKLLPKSYN